MGNHRTLWWIFQLATFEDTGRYLKIHNGQLGRLGEYLSDMLIPCSTGSSLCGIRQFFGPWEGHRNPCELTTIPSTWVSQYLIQLLTYVVAKNIYRLYIYINYIHTHEYPVKSQCWMIIYLLGRNPQAKLLPGPKAAVEICWERHPWRNVARKDYTTGGQVILRCCQQLSIHPKLPKQWVNLLHPK